MNLLDALSTVRSCARSSAQIRTRHGRAAVRTVEKKIQQLLRKKAWRDREPGEPFPVHMTDDAHLYPVSEDPLVAALRELATAEAEFVASIQELRSPRLRAAVEQANAALAALQDELAFQK